MEPRSGERARGPNGGPVAWPPGLGDRRYTLAETCLQHAARLENEPGKEARRLIGNLHWVTGRRDEYRNYLEEVAEQQPDPAETLRVLWRHDSDPYPVSGIGTALEKAMRVAPDDDRVWLGLADVATRSGRFDEADKWLTQCEKARPDDPAVWNARLNWSVAADRTDEFARAASHLQASTFPPARLLKLRTWLAARGEDRQAERAALDALLAVVPGDNAALERLADLAAEDRALDRVAVLRRRQSEMEAHTQQYKELINQPELQPHAAELARAAARIGRRFDARTWWGLAVRRDASLKREAEKAIEQLANTVPPPDPAHDTLAERLGINPGTFVASTAGAANLAFPTFVDDADRRGFSFMFDNGVSPSAQLPETMCGGIGLIDFDGDGWLDIYAIQGGPFPPPDGPLPFGDRLFRNRGGGQFEDVTRASGLDKFPGGYGHGIAVGDYDNDGRLDIFVTRWRSYALYHNLGQGRFEDVTARGAGRPPRLADIGGMGRPR